MVLSLQADSHRNPECPEIESEKTEHAILILDLIWLIDPRNFSQLEALQMLKARAHFCLLNSLDWAQSCWLAPDPPSLTSFSKYYLAQICKWLMNQAMMPRRPFYYFSYYQDTWFFPTACFPIDLEKQTHLCMFSLPLPFAPCCHLCWFACFNG